MFESLRFQALEPKAEAVAFPVQNLHPVARLVEENEKYGVEHGDLDIQLDQRSQAINGFSEVDRFGIEIHFFDFGVGSHHGELAPERNREHSFGDEVSALNVGLMERLLFASAQHSILMGSRQKGAKCGHFRSLHSRGLYIRNI
jgi:hypothetical protein